MKPWVPVVAYTSLRLGIFMAAWLLIQAFTPWRGLTALAAALLASGLVSLFLLNRHRDAMSSSVTGFFGRLNERIDRATRAEDADPPSGQGQPGPEAEPVDQDGEAGLLQDGDEGPSQRA